MADDYISVSHFGLIPKQDEKNDKLTLAYMIGFEKGKDAAIPQTHVLVPREPTKEMIDAALFAQIDDTDLTCIEVIKLYKAMIAAMPTGL